VEKTIFLNQKTVFSGNFQNNTKFLFAGLRGNAIITVEIIALFLLLLSICFKELDRDNNIKLFIAILSERPSRLVPKGISLFYWLKEYRTSKVFI
jgi:hypothetical protein